MDQNSRRLCQYTRGQIGWSTLFVELTTAGLETLLATRARREDWLTQALDRELDADQRDLLRQAVALLNRVAGA